MEYKALIAQIEAKNFEKIYFLHGEEAYYIDEITNAIIEHALSAHIKVLLTGMLAPPNLGTEYGKDFNSVYPLLARHHGLELYPFYLKGIVSDPLLNLEDGLHPNEKGVAVIVKNLMPKVKTLIAKIKK
jgi:acyl-CoA thioesterase-1